MRFSQKILIILLLISCKSIDISDTKTDSDFFSIKSESDQIDLSNEQCIDLANPNRIFLSKNDIYNLTKSPEDNLLFLEHFYEIDLGNNLSEIRLRTNGFNLDNFEAFKEKLNSSEKYVVRFIVSVFNMGANSYRHASFKLNCKINPSAPVLVVDGDSWSTNPINVDPIQILYEYYYPYQYSVDSYSKAGENLAEVWKEKRYIKGLRKNNGKILILSGGGNDIFDDFKKNIIESSELLENPISYLSESFMRDAENIMNTYTEILLDLRKNFNEVNVITHGYDCPFPKNGGKFLWPAFEKRGIPDAKRAAIMHTIIDIFNEKLIKLAEKFPELHFIDLRGTVQKSQWVDEIHPDPHGAKSIAYKIHLKIKEISDNLKIDRTQLNKKCSEYWES